MKHRLLIFTVLALCLALTLSACKDTPNNPSGTPSGNNPSQSNNSTPASNEPTQPGNSDSGNNGSSAAPSGLTASITPAEGWEKRDNISSRITYAYADTDKANNTLINLDTEENYLGLTEREFVEKRMETDKKSLESWNPVFTDIADVTVNGYDALAYDAVTELGELRKMYFIFEGSNVYIIQCGTMTEFWEIVQNDFSAMIESFTLK